MLSAHGQPLFKALVPRTVLFSSSGRSPKPFNLSVWLTKIRIIAGPLQAFFGVPYVEICILPYVATRESLRPPVDVSRSKIAKSWERSRLLHGQISLREAVRRGNRRISVLWNPCRCKRSHKGVAHAPLGPGTYSPQLAFLARSRHFGLHMFERPSPWKTAMRTTAVEVFCFCRHRAWVSCLEAARAPSVVRVG